jgi:alanine racemase
MRPVAQLVARILQVRLIDTPQTVGYGATYAAAGPTRVATLGLGYADGYKRALGNRGRAALAGRLVPVLGRVSMDLVTVDVTGLPDDAARPGAAVELLGASVPLDAVAEAAGTIPHDVLTGLGRRPVRRYVR